MKKNKQKRIRVGLEQGLSNGGTSEYSPLLGLEGGVHEQVELCALVCESAPLRWESFCRTSDDQLILPQRSQLRVPCPAKNFFGSCGAT